MRCISLWQPYASLVTIKAKQYETRNWSTPYRGRIAVHAAKSLESIRNLEASLFSVRECGQDISRFPMVEIVVPVMKAAGIKSTRSLPLGAVLCIAELIDCIPTAKIANDLDPIERACGDFTPGRFAWKLKVIEVFPQPIPAKGAQGIWEWER